jgi:hypothetical protein
LHSIFGTQLAFHAELSLRATAEKINLDHYPRIRNIARAVRARQKRTVTQLLPTLTGSRSATRSSPEVHYTQLERRDDALAFFFERVDWCRVHCHH